MTLSAPKRRNTAASIPRSALIALALLFLASVAHTQVVVMLHRPPPGLLHVSDLWRVDLTNMSGAPLSIRLYGRATESRSGQWIADGRSIPFTLSPGTRSVTPADLSPIDFDSDPDYEEVVRRTGLVPAGEYTICVYAIDARTNDTLGFDCIEEHVVVDIIPPQLIYPRSNSAVFEPLPAFTWTPVSPAVSLFDVTYGIKIAEIIGRQSPFDALESNPSWFDEADLSSTMAPYPLSAQPLEVGVSYAWQVIAYVRGGDGADGELARSDVGSFTFSKDSSDRIGDEPADVMEQERTDSTKARANDSGDAGGQTGNHRTDIDPVTSDGQSFQDGRERAVEAAAIREEERMKSVESCGNLRTEFQPVAQGDAGSYALVLTNNYTGASIDFMPKSFRLWIPNDSVIVVDEGKSKGWKQGATSTQPATGGMVWTRTSGTIPNGETALGTIRFGARHSGPFSVRYEWVDERERVICTDSTMLNQTRFYYDVSDLSPDAHFEIADEPLNVQYDHEYASPNDILISIYDLQTQAVVAPTTQGTIAASNVNGINRITVPLKSYGLRPGRHYVLTVSDPNGSHQFHFTLANVHEK